MLGTLSNKKKVLFFLLFNLYEVHNKAERKAVNYFHQISLLSRVSGELRDDRKVLDCLE